MKDLEQPGKSIRQRNNGNDTAKPLSQRKPPSPNQLPAHHPINIIYRVGVITGSLYILHIMEVFATVMRGPSVRHGWFKMGLATSVAIQMVKGYVELYDGKSKKKKIEYANYRNETHILLLLILIASISFHVSLWPAYGGLKTVFIMFVVGWGVLLQIALVVPTWVQNGVGFVGMTFLLQQYQ